MVVSYRMYVYMYVCNIHNVHGLIYQGSEQVDPSLSGDSTVSSTEAALEDRVQGLQSYLLTNFPRNSSDRERLIECGYNALLWDKVR